MSKREEEKAVEATKKVAEQAKSVADKQEAAADTTRNQATRNSTTISRVYKCIIR